MQSPKTLVSLGYYDRESPRHWSVCAQLKKEGWTIVECHTSAKGFLNKCRDLLGQYQAIRANVDAVLLPFPGHFLVPFAWLMTRIPRKRLFFDALISLYDTDIDDRKRFSRWNPRAWLLYVTDWIALRPPDETFIDTEQYRQYLLSTFHADPQKIRVIELQTRPDIFFPRRESPIPAPPFRILFYGTLIPLQGVEVIAKASALLKERNAPVHFTFIGPKKLHEAVAPLAKENVTIEPFATLRELAEEIRGSHLCLGIFGTSGKAMRVVPHKVVDGVACNVPVLTADSPAIRDRYAGNPLVHTCAAGNPEALANAIMHFIDHA